MEVNQNQTPELLPKLAFKLPATLWIKGEDSAEQVYVELVLNQKNDKVYFTFPECDREIEIQLGIDCDSLERSLDWLHHYDELQDCYAIIPCVPEPENLEENPNG